MRARSAPTGTYLLLEPKLASVEINEISAKIVKMLTFTLQTVAVFQHMATKTEWLCLVSRSGILRRRLERETDK